MKKILIALFLVSAIVGCKKENEKKDEIRIEGKWFVQQVLKSGFSGGIETEKNVNTTFTENDYIVFNGDGTAVSSYEGEGLQHSIFKISGKTLTLANPENSNEIVEFMMEIYTASTLVLVREITEVKKNVIYKDRIEVSFKRI